MRGGEKVLEVICELFPDATVFTLFHEPDRLSPTLQAMDAQASWANRFGLLRDNYRYLLPFLPRMIESFDLSEFDLVISSSHCVAKGVKPRPGKPHICYCHAPMRYVWDMYDVYFSKKHAGFAKRAMMRLCRKRLQRWDVASSDRVTAFLANSENIAGKIDRFYKREAEVIHPPVDCDFYTPGEGHEGAPYYFICSAMVPYKRLGIAIAACRQLGRRLVIAGAGPDEERLKSLGGGEVEFVGRVDDDELRDLYRGAKAFLFPGEEDFGITPLESMACGRPVIAFGKGGALETVVEGETGVFFRKQTAESLVEAIERFEAMSLDPDLARRHARKFSRPRFKQRLAEAIERHS